MLMQKTAVIYVNLTALTSGCLSDMDWLRVLSIGATAVHTFVWFFSFAARSMGSGGGLQSSDSESSDED